MPLRGNRSDLSKVPFRLLTKGISQMRLSHTFPVVSASFDDPNLVSCAGLVPVMGLAASAGLADLGDRYLSVPTDKGANAGGKVSALVARGATTKPPPLDFPVPGMFAE